MLSILLLTLVIIFLYKYGTKNFDYWRSKDIAYCRPLPFFGNSLKKYLQRISPTDQITEIYKCHPKDDYIGCFESNHCSLVLKNPEDIKKVLVTDFQYFYSKGINMHKTEPLLDNLFSADGDLWKLLRQKLSLAFTGAKLKKMFPTILSKAEMLAAILGKTNGAEVNIRELSSKYTTDVTTTYGFGLDTDSINNEDSIFSKLGKRMFTVSPRDALVSSLKLIAPEVFKHLNFYAPEIENRINSIYKSSIEGRDGKQSGRNDFIDILLSIRESGKLVGDSIENRQSDGTPMKTEVYLDDSVLAAQALILFGAGFETTSSAISSTLHLLAFNPDQQKKCLSEIDAILSTSNDLTYENMKEMKYLTMAYKEALRMYPPLGYLMRQATAKYTFSNNFTIDKGIVVLVPIQAMQNDEKYFEEPDKFIPERFHPDNVDKIPKNVYMPFGDGPRLCIGLSFGMLQAMVCLATILRHYTVVPSKNSRRKLSSEATTALVQQMEGGVPLAFVPREKK